MTDYYRSFCEGIADITEEQKEWIDHELNVDESTFSYDDDTSPEEIEAIEKAQDEFCDKYAIEDLCNWPEFNWSYEGGSMYIFSEEFGNVEQVGLFVSEFLRRFHPDMAFTLQYADTASRSVAEGFGGGAIFVTKDGVEYMDTCDWAQKKLKEWSGE